MESFFHSRKNLLLLLVLFSIAVQVVFFLFLPSPEERNVTADYTVFYEPVAVNLMNGKGIVENNGNIALRYPPGYPLILGPVLQTADYLEIGRLHLVEILNVCMTAVSCILIFLIGETVFSRRIGLLGGLMWATYPFNLWLVKGPNSEVPFMLLLFLSIYLFVSGLNSDRMRSLFFAGVILALSALVRPISLALIVVFIAVLFFIRAIPISRRVLSIILLVAGFAIALMPWEYYMYSKTGDVIPLSTGGTPSIKDGLQFVIRPTLVSGVQIEVPDDVMDFMVRIQDNDARLKTTGDVVRYMINELNENPATVVKVFAIKIVRSWYATSQMWYENYIWPVQLIYLALGLAGLIISLSRRSGRTAFILLFVGVVLYFWFMTVLVMSILRYMVPAMALVIIFAAIPLDCVLSRIHLYRKYEMTAARSE